MKASPGSQGKRHRVSNVRMGSVAGSIALCVFAGPASALQREVGIRFQPPQDSEVAGYVVYALDEATGDEQAFDIGFVAPGLDGVANATVALEETHRHDVTMTAYNLTGESVRSNAIVVDAIAPVCDPRPCDDGNPCTANSCDALGCLSAPVADGTACDDGYVDTVEDQCLAGVCEGRVLACRDDLDCDDGNLCNGLESCDGGVVCLEGTPLDCGEPTACAVPRCDATAGCLVEYQPDGTPCDDGLSETLEDACLGGVCQGLASAPAGDPALESVTPDVVARGRYTLEIHGRGFVVGAVLSFVNGEGRPPKVKSLQLVDEGLLLATVDVSGGGPRRPRTFDARLDLPDGRVLLLRDALVRLDR